MKNRQTKKEISLNEYVGFTLKCSTTLSLMVGRKVKNNGKMLKIPEGDGNPRFITLSFSLLYSTISKETGKEKKKKNTIIKQSMFSFISSHFSSSGIIFCFTKHQGLPQWSVQQTGTRLPKQEIWVGSLVLEDSTCHRATEPVHHNYGTRALESGSHNC